ncbi:MAG: carboxypeptidase-like regulatory domain-containing protein [Prevotella sp.]|nr:carboxypeptidase-like regulatory domain-containing protein [Prevotella sp.]
MRRVFLVLLIAFICGVVWAQNVVDGGATNGMKAVISGTVYQEKSNIPVRQASVVAEGTHVSVVTNEDGFFTLKADVPPKYITVSHLGYQSKRIRITPGQTEPLRVLLKPTAVELKEVVVWTGDPRELVNIAIRKIPDNYSNKPELFNAFYRETAMKRQHYVYVAEGVVDMYKTSYKHGNLKDKVAIRKGRRLLSPRRGDTLSVKVMGGPVQPVQLDIAKNLDFLFNEEDLRCYDFSMLEPTTINDRQQYVVAIEPKWSLDWALFYGKLYIDRETLAFTRAELSLDMSDIDKATRMMLVKKPLGVKFRPKELVTLIDYRYEDGVTRLSYVRNTFRFNCDWKRRLFATAFTAVCEMVVTDKAKTEVHPIAGRDSFDSRDAFYDKVDYFRDPHFWENYNIIEPSESLDKAIDKLVKRYK